MPSSAILAALCVALCWGGNFPASKFALIDFPPFLTIVLRFALVCLLLAPVALRLPRPSLRDMAVITLTNIVMQFALIFYAMAQGLHITSAIVAMQLGVPFSCLMAAVVFKDYLGPWRAFGLGVAFLGVVMVAGTPNAAEHSGAFLLAVCGAFGWSLANIYLKRMQPVPPVVMLFWTGLLAIPPMALLSLLFESGQWAALAQAHLPSWLGVAYSALVSSIVGYGLWSRLIATYPMSQVVPYSLLVPVGGIAGGVLIFDEPFSGMMLAGAALTMLGVAIISLRRPKLVQLENG